MDGGTQEKVRRVRRRRQGDERWSIGTRWCRRSTTRGSYVRHKITGNTMETFGRVYDTDQGCCAWALEQREPATKTWRHFQRYLTRLKKNDGEGRAERIPREGTTGGDATLRGESKSNRTRRKKRGGRNEAAARTTEVGRDEASRREGDRDTGAARATRRGGRDEAARATTRAGDGKRRNKGLGRIVKQLLREARTEEFTGTGYGGTRRATNEHMTLGQRGTGRTHGPRDRRCCENGFASNMCDDGERKSQTQHRDHLVRQGQI